MLTRKGRDAMWRLVHDERSTNAHGDALLTFSGAVVLFPSTRPASVRGVATIF